MDSSAEDDFINQKSENLKLINSNIKSSTNEKIIAELIQAKIICLIELNKFSMAIYTIKMAKKYKRIPESSFIFETIYCYYRLSKFNFALKYLDDHNQTNGTNLLSQSRFKVLKAQILYRLERFNESAEIFQELLDCNELTAQTEEIKVNLLAAQAQARIHVNISEEEEFTSFESAYNASIAKFLAKDYKVAEKYANHCEEIYKNNIEGLNSSDLVYSKIISTCALAADNDHENVYEAEALFRKLLASENKYSLQSNIIKANLVYTAIKTGNLKDVPKIDAKKLNSLNLFNYQKNQIRSNLIQCKSELQKSKTCKESSITMIKTTTKKQCKRVNEKKLDKERWIPLRDRTTYKPKSVYLKSKNILEKNAKAKGKK